ncbi:MAG: SDR family oxidoreductase [Balneolaceae bacterium]|nr:SDR family oxidoreductase [Balneolaceae bacterium]
MTKNILVTGASRGIGYQISTSLAQQDHNVIAVARSKKELKKLRNAFPDNIDFFQVDLTSTQQLDELAKYLSESISGIDVLINNAGALINKPFMELSRSDWQHMLDVNLMSVINLIKSAVPVLNKGSHIVNISSMGGFQGSDKFPGLTAYSVAKGAVSILSECLAEELSEQVISVNALCLGSVQTKMFKTAFPDFEADVSPEEMGTYIADFALNGSTFYNGKVLPVALRNPS